MTFLLRLSTKKVMFSKLVMTIFSAFLLLLLMTINGCHSFFSSPVVASTFVFHGPLKVALQEDLIAKSLEKDLVNRFAQTQSLKIKFIPFKNLSQVEELLEQQKVDLVFTRSTLSTGDFKKHCSQAYDDLKLAVVCKKTIAESRDLYIPDRFFSATQTQSFRTSFKKLHWTKTSLSNFKLKGLVNKNSESCFLTDIRLAQKNQLTNPDLKIVWTSKQSQSVVWVTRFDLKELNQLIYSWFQGLVRKNQIAKLWDQYEAFKFKMSFTEQRRFQKDVSQKLPQWKSLFEKSAKKNHIPWTLLAAVAYQESKWDEDARSYTGVRGLMQITTLTAQRLGIEDRKDPIQSIEGGAFYLKYMYDKTSKNLTPYERWAQALAAYNMGWAHLRDARHLAAKLNKDPQRWLQLKTILPLLENERYLPELAFGSARGEETVEFVDQVFGYTEVLNNSFTQRLLTSQDF